METAQQILALWLRERIAPALREAGYTGSGQTFHRRLDRNWGVVNIQRSQWDSTERATFAINLGTASAIVLESCGKDPNGPPLEVHRQWRIRLGELVAGRDLWWEIRSDATDASLLLLAVEVRSSLLAVGLPAIDHHAAEREMLDAKLKLHRSTYRELGEIGVLLHAVGGTIEQQQEFRSRVEKAREWVLRYDEDARPAQGPKRTEANLARLDDARPDRRAEAVYLLGGSKPTTLIFEALRERLSDSIRACEPRLHAPSLTSGIAPAWTA